MICLFVVIDDTDECLSNPCANGATCLDGVDSYTCVWPEGFTGTIWQIDLLLYNV